MALLVTQAQGEDGTGVTPVTATAGGDTMNLNGTTTLRVVNAHATLARTVTIAAAINCNQGFNHPLAVVVAALTTQDTPLLRPDRFGSQPSITYSDAADSLTVAAVDMASNAGLT